MGNEAVAGAGRDRPVIMEDLYRHLRYTLGKDRREASAGDYFKSLCLAVRDRLIDGMIETERRYVREDRKRVYYLSLEFLIGRSLGNNLLNLRLYEIFQEALTAAGLDLESLREEERDAPLGNGGLGRLAACFLDSMATLGIAGFGYGLHYEFGLFKQVIENGYQREKPDFWPSRQDPWELERADEACLVPVYGRIEHGVDRRGGYNPMWLDWQVIVGVPYDMPVAGYGGKTVNYLRLYAARASSEFDTEIFNEGDYLRAVQDKIAAETVSKVLYPADSFAAGRELRLIQEYFLVACALRDIIRRYRHRHVSFDAFPEKTAIQMNDTHPALAVAELMRQLVDEYELPWERAWEITVATLGYTNHTLLSEALEKWPVALLEKVLPRHLQIIYEINRRLLAEIERRWPGDPDRMGRMSLIEEDPEKKVRMAYLAVVGSHAVNGVSALHSELIKNELVPDFHALWPERFGNQTNGITPRRWLLKANPRLAELITATIGDTWVVDLPELRRLEDFAEDRSFLTALGDVKKRNKEDLQKVIRATTGVSVSPESLFAVQAKRIHEYKRQLLKVLYIVYEYLLLVEDGWVPPIPRTHIFAGKAAPGYWQAKQIIKLIHCLGEVINGDPRAAEFIKVVFIPDYRVSLAERIIPAADLSEQLSTAGTEASGTGNMKFALNGALTIGTLDGANIEIRDEVGAENIYIFGLTIEEVRRFRRTGGYDPGEWYRHHPPIRRVMDALRDGLFSPRERDLSRWVWDRIIAGGDFYFHLPDLLSYQEAQERVGRDYGDEVLWTRRAAVNIARMGRFSSDRTIAGYARDIWGIR
ncbi:MAG TPA: glycogen/starch/alpha-glucan phosphorylase [Syntrophales bacterium]|nr:glycogen/starch/alpha-glucan phosphorylase [Syntrophales bacterium]HPC32849.1 glycogen/starch/alpha-glucan phosphorylase [Syntrophales bacterium]HQI35889.1 glycogen/starch/alpha-glucan phosphorylase [Syntrophales bacterium]HQJ30419.1 glycogen/starch/alpha-glucan phosphorylase [Syntrophales bacterium]